MNWITTPLESGALQQNNYSSSITGLSASTIYQYRAYMVVSGQSYYGDIKQITTCSSLAIPPAVSTGCACNVEDTTMRFCLNQLTSAGNSPIDEYGVIYTQNNSQAPSESVLVIGGSESSSGFIINKKSICTSIPVNNCYFLGTAGEVSGLTENTYTYYRAFAHNSHGYAYGTIKNTLTCISEPPTSYVTLDVTSKISVDASNGIICFNPVLSTPECASIILNIEQSTAIGSESPSITEICCQAAGAESAPVGVFYCATSAGSYSNNDFVLSIKPGDSIYWSHSSYGGSGSCSTIKICDIDTQNCVNVVINSLGYCDLVISSSF
jgi:hypothetical protein